MRVLRSLKSACLALAAWFICGAALAQAPPSIPSIDAPELAALGPYAVGLKRETLTQPAQADLASLDAKGVAPIKDRVLPLSIWYPARVVAGASAVTYSATMDGEPGKPPVAFSAPGIAVLDAPAVAGGRFPLVILSHGYAGCPEAMTWLGENLASKGYVVVAISHRDPPYGDPRGFPGPVLRRPLDIAFVARSIQGAARSGDAFLSGLIDPDRVAVIGYSMGGYGALTMAAGGFDPAGLPAHALPAAYVGPYLPGGAKADEARIEGLKAVVALSPFTGLPGAPAWSPQTLARVRTPLLLIVGDRDHVVGFSGVKAVFDATTGASRRLLVFENGDHSIPMNPASPEARASLWGLDWFEDPVWRKDRTIGINLHMISAFLDLHMKGDASRAAYLDVATPKSDDAVWPATAARAYGAYSPGAAPITVWKGFQRLHDAGLELWRGDPVR